MRILMLDNEFPPLGGGMGTANLALFRQFSKYDDIQIDLVTAALGSRFQSERFSDQINIYKVPVWNRDLHHSSNRELIFYTFQALFFSLYLLFRNRYNFCFAWSTLPAGAIAFWLFKATGLPYMVWASGPDIPGFEQRYDRLYPILLPLIRSIWRHAKPLIAKCHEEVDLIHKSDVHTPVQIIPNGADLEGFISARFSDLDGPLKIICVARLIERKGQHHLIRAVKMLKERGISIQVDLIGTGDSLEAFYKLASDLDVSDSIKFLGYVPREEIAQYYAASHLFVLSSYYEGMSLAALEAMSAGLPLILTRTGGTSELVIEGVNGYTYEWGDVDGLVVLIQKIAESRDRLRQMGTISRQIASQFSWPIIAHRYIEIFSQNTTVSLQSEVSA